MSPWARLRRHTHRLLGAVGASTLFLATFVTSVVLHGDLPSSRRFVASTTTRLLAPLFRGRILVHAIDHLGFDGLDIQRAEVLDPWGQQVISLQGIHARLPVAQALRRLALGGGAIALTVDDLQVDQVEVNLDLGPDGQLRVQSAFALKKVAAASAPSSPGSLRIEFPRVQVGLGRTRGEPVRGMPVRARGARIPGSLLVTEREVTLDIEPFGARARVLAPLDPIGTADYHLRLAEGQPLKMWAGFHGKVAGVTVGASARMEGLQVTGQVDAVRIDPEDLRTLLPQVPLTEGASLQGKLRGTLPDLHADLRLLAGRTSEATVEADLRLVQGVEMDARWSLRHLDPRLFAPTAPAASLGGDGRVWLRSNEAGLRAELEVATFPFSLGEQVIPGVTATASFDGAKLQGKATIHEPGVENSLAFRVGAERVAEVDAQVAAPQLRAVTRLQGVIDGAVKTRIEARIAPDGTLDASVQGSYRGLRKGAFQVGGGTFQTRLRGPLEQLSAETAITGEVLDLGGFRVRRVVVGAAGPLLSPSVHLALQDDRWKGLSLSAGLRLGASPSLSDLLLRFQGDEGLAVDAKVAQVTVGPGGVDLRGLELRGATIQARGSLSLRPAGLRVELQDGHVDLPSVARYLAPRVGAPALARLTSGALSFSGKIDADGPRRHGNFTVRLADLCSREYPVVLDGEAHLGLSGEQASSTFSTRLMQATCKGSPEDPEVVLREQIGTARGQAIGTIRGSLLDGRNWKNAAGSVELLELTARLDQLSNHPLVEELRQARSKGPASRRVPRFGGQLGATASVVRLDPRQLPGVQITVASKEFHAEIPRDSEPPLLLEGLDLRAALALAPTLDAPGAGAPGSLGAAMSVAVDHGAHEIVQLGAATSFRPEDARREIARLLQDPTSPEAQAWLRSRPLRGKLLFHEQPLEELPELLRPLPLRGKARVAGEFSGTAERPEVSVKVDVQDLRRITTEWDPWKMNAALQATFDERGLVLRGELGHTAESVPGSDGKASFWVMSTRRLGDLLWRRGTRWQADAEARLERWHLEAIPMLAARGIQGRVSGVMQAFRMNVQPQLWADLSLDDGKLADASIAPAKLTVSLVEGGGFATVALHQPPPRPGETGGELALTAFPIITFRDRLFPTLDRQQRHPISLRLSRFDIEPFAPLVTPVLADLRGKLDGELTLAVGQNPADNAISGGLRWSHGVLLIPQLGQTFTGGQFNVSSIPLPASKETRFEVRDMSLSATSGRVGGEASFVVPNDLLARYLFPPEKGPSTPEIRGDFSVSIAQNEKIPVTFEGLALGDAHGKTDGKILFRGGELLVDVAIPELTFDLPETTGQQNLQDLGNNPEIAIVEASRKATRRRDPEKKPLVVRVNLGLGATLEDLVNGRDPSGSVLVRRASVDVRLAGIAHSTLDGELSMTGTVETLSGRIVALGKPFDVRRGFVRFEGSATNPYLNVGASWDSPDGTRVFADLQGYLKEAQFRLRSEPARSEGEVLSLVLFGRDPSSNTGTKLGHPSNTDSNLALGGGVASTLLNSFLDPVQVFGRRIETRVDATSNRGTSIGVAAEIRPRLWAQVDVSTSSQRERQNSDLSAVTLDWRFRPNWSLRTTVGDRGSSLMELLWQFKY